MTAASLPIPELAPYDYSASANCYKVRQLGRDYTRVPIDIFAGHTLTDSYARINPFRSTPALEVAPNRVLIESNAILVHLAAGTRFLPTDPASTARSSAC